LLFSDDKDKIFFEKSCNERGCRQTTAHRIMISNAQRRYIMLRIKIYASNSKSRIFLCLILALMNLVFAGCGSVTYGRLENSPEVTQVFKSGEILSNYQYYISGFQRVPYAIIAIDSKYQLRSGRWQALDMDSATLNQIVFQMDSVYSLTPRGAWIVDQEGHRLGVWYSSQYQTTVEREKNNQIMVVSPEPPDLRGIH
jgi:hypothetical protein